MTKKKVVCVVQARMGSTRLPKKVMMPLCRKPMIEHIYLRVMKAKNVDEVIIATSTSTKDDELCDFLDGKGIKFFRGSEEDVLSRYYEVSQKLHADVIIRITGDCPLIDPNLVEQMVSVFVDSCCDYMSPKSELGLIRGLDTEIFTADALKRAHTLAEDSCFREHVTLYMYRMPDKFKIALFPIPAHLKSYDIRLCVDELEDYKLISEVYETLYNESDIIDIKDVLQLFEQRPHLSLVNSSVKQRNV